MRLDEVPRHVVTQGLGTIGEARHAVLVATGAAKAAPIAAAVEGPLTAMCPASVLQLHPHATVVVDEAAAAGLRLADYYRDVFAGKPAVAAAVTGLRLDAGSCRRARAPGTLRLRLVNTGPARADRGSS